MRVLRSLGFVLLGAWGGFMAAAAVAKRALPSSGDEASDEVALVAIFDGVDLKSRAGAFRGGSVLAWYGGVELDLREATIAPEGATLSIRALFGGVAVRVPQTWRVESAATALAGGVQALGAEEDDAPTLRVEGSALFGGISVAPAR